MAANGLPACVAAGSGGRHSWEDPLPESFVMGVGGGVAFSFDNATLRSPTPKQIEQMIAEWHAAPIRKRVCTLIRLWYKKPKFSSMLRDALGHEDFLKRRRSADLIDRRHRREELARQRAAAAMAPPPAAAAAAEVLDLSIDLAGDSPNHEDDDFNSDDDDFMYDLDEPDWAGLTPPTAKTEPVGNANRMVMESFPYEPGSSSTSSSSASVPTATLPAVLPTGGPEPRASVIDTDGDDGMVDSARHLGIAWV